MSCSACGRWRGTGLVTELHDRLREAVRRAEGRSPEPSAGVVDSQSVKADATVAHVSRGFDAGKKINGRKRHLLTDTLRLLLTVLVTPASTTDRDAARTLLTQEEHLAAVLREIGPMIAVGRPGEKPPEAGAQRLYLKDEDWKIQVQKLMDMAHMVILAMNSSVGLQWELKQARERLQPHQMVLFCPCI